VSVTPYIEMLMGHGYPATGRLFERGVRPGLGPDVATSGPSDMFSVMRSTYAAERIRTFATADVNVPFLPTITHRDVLECATIAGARACRLADRVGSITTGKDADIVLLRVDQLNTSPALNPTATVVAVADTSNVDSVFVRGQALKRAGAMLKPDMAFLLERGRASAEYLLASKEVPTV
jgi:cytosine/adenosine deaminase-related metal-dependent hydrolase